MAAYYSYTPGKSVVIPSTGLLREESTLAFCLRVLLGHVKRPLLALVLVSIYLIGSPAQTSPVISSLSPSAGPVGSSVLIAGSTFGAMQGAGTVTFNGIVANVTSWSANSITAVAPAGTSTGNVAVTVAGAASAGAPFTVLPPPAIDTLIPGSGPVGSAIVIAGSNLGATQGGSTVTFNGTAAVVSSWSNTSVVAQVPAGAASGNVVVTAAGGVSTAGLNFTVAPAPSISSLAPITGAVGSPVTIAGTNFGLTQGNGTVTFNGTPVTLLQWNNSSIVVGVPAGATSGNVVVTAAGGVSSPGVNFSVLPAPVISSVSPGSGAVGALVTITGNNFGPTQGTSSTVTFNGAIAIARGHLAVSWSNTSIEAYVPSGATSGNVVVTVGGKASNPAVFGVGTFLDGLTPASGPAGALISVFGSGFGNSQGQSTVTFNGIAAGSASWSDSGILVPVPSGVTTGNVVVTVGGVASNGVLFTAAPVISSLSAGTLAEGAPLTITGVNFGASSSQGAGTVTFNGITAIPSSWSNTSIVVPVPMGAMSGNVVTTANGMASNGVSFTPGPFVSSVSLTSAGAGTPVTITGGNFGAGQGGSTVTFNGIAATPSSWSNTSIVVPVPSGATSGNLLVTVGGLASNSLSFAVAPAIGSLSPASGPAGTSVTITGTTFGANQGGSTVTFNGVSATPGSWSNTSIVVPVPIGATTGNVVVTAGGLASNGSLFTEAPVTSSLSASTLAVCAPLTITGMNFGASQGAGTVTFNGTAANPTSWSSTSIVVPVPMGATPGNVVVTANGMASNGVSFAPGPFVSALSSSSAAVGTAITITGGNFGASQGANTAASSVTFNGVAATSSSWSNTSIVVPVPSAATGGNVVVTVGGVASNGLSIAVPPAVGGLSPASGPVGTDVTITGTTFGASQGGSTVAFNGTPAAPIVWSSIQISVPVPVGATTGNVVVTVGGVASNGALFTAAPVIGSISAGSLPVGDALTITGLNFGASQGGGAVTFNGTAAIPISWSSTSIMVPVPTGAMSGNVVVTANGMASNGVSFTPGPFINSLSLSSGAVGTPITITGMNFGASQGASSVTFNGVTATPSNWSSTSIVVPVPSGTTTGDVVITVGGLFSNGFGFTVGPSISGLTPNAGAVGSSVTITGTTFGAGQGSTVTFNGITATPSSWSSTQIVVPVPGGATTGNVVVTVEGLASNGVLFTVGPVINSLSVGTLAIGASLTINGQNFGAGQGTSTVTFNGTAAIPTSWNNNTIVVPVPNGATGGNVVVTVGGMASNGVTFTPGPFIGALSTASGALGTPVTITGGNFGASQGSSAVAFNGITATPSSWSNNSIVVPVPNDATSGNVVVLVGSLASNGVPFAVAPGISSLSPTSGVVGTAVTITGTNFGASQGSSTVSFNGAAAASTSWSNTQIVVAVPSAATTGNVVVTVGGLASNGVLFTAVPLITGLSPNPTPADTLVTISGSSFGASQGSSTVTFNGVAAAVSSWSNTSITAVVPANATPGPVVVTVDGVASNGFAFSLASGYSFSLGYAPNGNVLSANDSVNGNWTYGYDDFNRLSTAVATNGNSCIESYDQYGNRVSQQPYGPGNSCPGSSFSFTGNGNGNNNRIDGYSYDAAGNLLNDGQHNYTYDAENRIIQVDGGQTAAYTYDADGQRIQKVSTAGTAAYLYDLDGHQITELNGSGAWTRGEVYVGGRHLATYGDGSDAMTYFVQADWLGTERTRVLPSGDLAETCTNFPFGDGLNCNSSAGPGANLIFPSPDHFTGKELDAEDGLNYFGARYYSSSLGRFITPDWAAKPAAIPYAVLGDPQSLNLYSYVRNRPTAMVDPDGHFGGDGQCKGLANCKVSQGQQSYVFATEDTVAVTTNQTTMVEGTDENGNDVKRSTTTETVSFYSRDEGHEGQYLGSVQRGLGTIETTSAPDAAQRAGSLDPGVSYKDLGGQTDWQKSKMTAGDAQRTMGGAAVSEMISATKPGIVWGAAKDAVTNKQTYRKLTELAVVAGEKGPLAAAAAIIWSAIDIGESVSRYRSGKPQE